MTIVPPFVFLYNFLWLLSFITFLFEDLEGVADAIRLTLGVKEAPGLEETFHLGSEGRDGSFEALLLLGLGAPLCGDGVVVLGLLVDKIKGLVELELVELAVVLELGAGDLLLGHSLLGEGDSVGFDLCHALFAGVNEFREGTGFFDSVHVVEDSVIGIDECLGKFV